MLSEFAPRIVEGTDRRGPAPRSPGRVGLKRVVVALLVALIIGLGISTVFRAAISPIQRTDFTVYQLAGRAVLDGTDIYAVRNVRGWAYVYPPPFAVVMAPFACLSVFWGALIWYLISVGLTALAVRMCVQRLRDDTPP